MKKQSFITIILNVFIIFVFGQFTGSDTAFGLSLMGPPRSLLQERQSSIALELGYSEMDLESFGEVTEVHVSPFSSDIKYRKYNIENLKSVMPSIRVETNIFENWDIFLRLGATDAASDITEEQAGGANGRQFNDFDSGFGFLWGLGTRTTFYKEENTTWGGIFQFNYINPGSSDITDENDINFSGSAELDFWEVQLAIGPTIEYNNVRLYGGPFLHFVNGDLAFSGSTVDPVPVVMTVDASPEIREKSQIGGFVGAQWNLGNDNTLITESQITGDAWGIGVSMAWKF